ncbi:MAG: DNA methylase [Candidatus Curtissbacteria bacterium]|nr:DNA methylase [Candidatus Curtissbacteria bacterium]
MKKNIYSKDLGIDIESKKETELFKWFLACLLFGKPIQQKVARNTYLELLKEGLITPDSIIDAGWDKLVKVLDRGHYVRYDFSSATKLLEVSKKLKRDYKTLTNLFELAKSKKDLEEKLFEFKGVGPKTVSIFLRDVSPVFKFKTCD